MPISNYAIHNKLKKSKSQEAICKGLTIMLQYYYMYKDKMIQWEKDREELYNLWKEGHSMNDIARMKNTTVSNVFNKIKKYRHAQKKN